METEVRYYYSIDSKEDLINDLLNMGELIYQGRFYEITDQYNHPMEEYDFYKESIDGRFRVRKTIGKDSSRCMITWKRRLKNKREWIHNEEEVEVKISPKDYDNLCILLEHVLHLQKVESYERYRNVFTGTDIEIVVDEYPFGLCLEIENKGEDNNPEKTIQYWLEKLGLDLKDAYVLSWDDKYADLCKEQNKIVELIVRFDKDMPQETKKYVSKAI